jgi:hypothetical protein
MRHASREQPVDLVFSSSISIRTDSASLCRHLTISRLILSDSDSRFRIPDSQWPGVVVAIALLATYAAALAPTITLWDSGEFNAAVASLGIPHPPGTPLYILIANVWAKGLGFLPLALAVNILSAVASATACGLLAGLINRWTGNRVAAIAAGLSSGTMLAVWQNATETEIYALSLLLGVLMVVVGDRAGVTGDRRMRYLLAFLMALAVPIQISALIAAPAAIFLASWNEDATIDRYRLVTLGAVLVIVAGVGVVSVGITVVGVLLLLGVSARGGPSARWEGLGIAAILVVGFSPTLFMLVRAAHDPLINQGNPSTIPALIDVVARNQYPLPGFWPRAAPVWIQLLNLVQYADWQVASGLDASVAASWRRTPWSIAASLLVLAGWRHIHSVNRRASLGLGALLLMSSLGVVAVLNLRASPSILDSVLPPGATHEPRERDYFFALAFGTVGLVAGVGAVITARRWVAPRMAAPAGLAVAALPLVLNWQAANRRPEGHLADTLGESLLASVPPNAMLLVAGDNDSYTTWYRQAALNDRRDVVPVTVSLLPAGWYREELARRHALLEPDQVNAWRGDLPVLRALVEGARREGRPVAAAVSVSRSVRQALAPGWTLGGTAYVADFSGAPRGDAIDVASVERVANLVNARSSAIDYKGRDPAVPYVVRLLRCPSQAQGASVAAGDGALGASLDSRCNFK